MRTTTPTPSLLALTVTITIIALSVLVALATIAATSATISITVIVLVTSPSLPPCPPPSPDRLRTGSGRGALHTEATRQDTGKQEQEEKTATITHLMTHHTPQLISLMAIWSMISDGGQCVEIVVMTVGVFYDGFLTMT